MVDAKPTMTAPRLRHPDLAVHVDVTLVESDGRWLAVAMLADEPDVGTAATRGRRSEPRSPVARKSRALIMSARPATWTTSWLSLAAAGMLTIGRDASGAEASTQTPEGA